MSTPNAIIFSVTEQDAKKLAVVFNISSFDTKLSSNELQVQTTIAGCRKWKIGEELANFFSDTTSRKSIVREYKENE